VALQENKKRDRSLVVTVFLRLFLKNYKESYLISKYSD